MHIVSHFDQMLWWSYQTVLAPQGWLCFCALTVIYRNLLVSLCVALPRNKLFNNINMYFLWKLSVHIAFYWHKFYELLVLIIACDLCNKVINTDIYRFLLFLN